MQLQMESVFPAYPQHIYLLDVSTLSYVGYVCLFVIPEKGFKYFIETLLFLASTCYFGAAPMKFAIIFCLLLFWHK